MLMSETVWDGRFSTSPLGEELLVEGLLVEGLLVEGLLVEELQGSTPHHDVCSSPMHLQEVNTIVLFVIQPVCRRRDCCADGRDFSSWLATPA